MTSPISSSSSSNNVTPVTPSNTVPVNTAHPVGPTGSGKKGAAVGSAQYIDPNAVTTTTQQIIQQQIQQQTILQNDEARSARAKYRDLSNGPNRI
jgi:hypothetical protein